MLNKRRQPNSRDRGPQLPPIITEDDGELPFFTKDYFSDVALLVSTTSGDTSSSQHPGAKGSPKTSVSGKQLFSARCLLAYNSPVFEKMLANAKKHELDMSQKKYDDVVELLCFLDPRVPYTITAQTAKQLLPLAEEYEMYKLRRECENVLHTAYEALRKENRPGTIPFAVNEEYLILADRYNFERLLNMCIDEYVHNNSDDSNASVINLDAVSENVKLLILQRKLARLKDALEKERKYKQTAESELGMKSPKKKWNIRFDYY